LVRGGEREKGVKKGAAAAAAVVAPAGGGQEATEGLITQSRASQETTYLA
jgi:hypothetical protein